MMQFGYYRVKLAKNPQFFGSRKPSEEAETIKIL